MEARRGGGVRKSGTGEGGIGMREMPRAGS